jgi:hypothetical protein
MKYIFMAGAPGSKWSSVAKNIYFSADIDRSDANSQREYWHDASGTRQLMHMGAYFDPGMEMDLPVDLSLHSREHLEQLFDSAFAPDGTGVRIIKSHIFSHHLNFIKETWPECPVVLVHRPDDACLGWWVKCGHFNITYPKYDKYYIDLRHMAGIIAKQNADILTAWYDNSCFFLGDNVTLADTLGIARPPKEYYQSYTAADIEVTVL